MKKFQEHSHHIDALRSKHTFLLATIISNIMAAKKKAAKKKAPAKKKVAKKKKA